MSAPTESTVIGHAPTDTGPQRQTEESGAIKHAREFLLQNYHLDTSKLKDALSAVYGEGFAAGTVTALQQTGSGQPLPGVHLDVPTSDQEWSRYWDSWQPAQTRAGAELLGGGLSRLLDQADITINGITGSALDRLGTILGRGALAGDSVDTIARDMSSVIADPARARMIATTEIARAVSAGSNAQYRQDGISRVKIINSPGACPTCRALADRPSIPLKDSDAYVPVHPNCRCSLAPVLNALTLGPDLSQDVLTVAAGFGAGAGVSAGDEVLHGAEDESLLQHMVDRGKDRLDTLVDQHIEDRRGASGATPSSTTTEPVDLSGNTGGGMSAAEENTGGGQTLFEQNTGGGTAGLSSNTGGGSDRTEENLGGSGSTLPEVFPGLAAVQAENHPPKPATRRTRKRPRRKG